MKRMELSIVVSDRGLGRMFVKLFVEKNITKSSSGPQTLRGFLRMASPLLRKRHSVFGSAEQRRYASQEYEEKLCSGH